MSKISLDQIERRLGGNLNTSTSASSDSDDDSGSSVLLYSGIVATLVAMGAAAFFWEEISSGDVHQAWRSPPPAPIVMSQLEKKCREGWTKNEDNADQIYCFMTTDIKRFCKPAEKAALIRFIGDYQIDYDGWRTKGMVGALKTVGKMQTQGLTIGLEEAKMRKVLSDPNIPDDVKMKTQERFMKRMTDVMSDMNPDSKSRRVVKHPGTREDNTAVLIRSGLLSSKDFEGSAPKWFKKVEREVKTIGNICPHAS
jgi:hypothetical protein